MEVAFPGVQVYIAHKNEANYIFTNSKNCLNLDELESSRDNFAYIREIVCDMESHPIENFMLESDIPCGPISTPAMPKSNRCVLLSNGMMPTTSLTKSQVKDIQLLVENEGFLVDIDGDVTNAECVIGVECEQLFEAAAKGSKVTLVSTGVGEGLFKKMFPKGVVLKI
jgi:hypothetical protein